MLLRRPGGELLFAKQDHPSDELFLVFYKRILFFKRAYLQ